MKHVLLCFDFVFLLNEFAFLVIVHAFKYLVRQFCECFAVMLAQKVDSN